MNNLPIQNSYTYSPVPQPKWLVIFVHGLTSSKDEEIFLQWEKFFNEWWFSTLRINLYWEWDWEKRLNEVSLSDHIDDVNSVINYCSLNLFNQIILIWHSYGCVVNLYVDLSKVMGLIMIDPSMWWKELMQDVYEDEKWWHYIDRWDGYHHQIGENLYKDFLIPTENYLDKMSKVTIPVKIIWAENWLANNAKQYYEVANQPKELNIISWANHRFDEWWMSEVINESLKWMNKIIIW